jgi:hypothetical protein
VWPCNIFAKGSKSGLDWKQGWLDLKAPAFSTPSIETAISFDTAIVQLQDAV